LSGANLRRDYFPFGEHYIASGDGTHYLFTGKELDEGTGLSYFGARYYDASICRWLSVDPLAGNYPSLSPYLYSANNPINILDPDGMKIVNTNDSLYNEMFSEMTDADKEYYKNLEDSDEEFEFSDVYNGWKIVKKARDYIDKLKYVWGGESLSNGADCSGFVWAVLKELGYSVGNRSGFTSSSIIGDNGNLNFSFLRYLKTKTSNIDGVPIKTESAIWGDVIIWNGSHLGFYDPSPITNIPGKNYSGVLLSARQGYGKVHYADPKWWTFGSGNMSAKGPTWILRAIK